MPTKVKLLAGDTEFSAVLDDSETGRALAQRLPFEVRMSRWGDEYYGDVGTPLEVAKSPDARDLMEVGELAFWLPGNALCIFFGPTPASEGSEPRAASEVNPAGRITSDVKPLKSLGASVTFRLEKDDG